MVIKLTLKDVLEKAIQKEVESRLLYIDLSLSLPLPFYSQCVAYNRDIYVFFYLLFRKFRRVHTYQ